MLYSLVADIISFIMFLMAGFIGLLNGKSLENASAWRSSIEQAIAIGPNVIMDEWEKRGLPLPVDLKELDTELVKARNVENSLRRSRKTKIAALMGGGAIFFFLARYFSILGT